MTSAYPLAHPSQSGNDFKLSCAPRTSMRRRAADRSEAHSEALIMSRVVDYRTGNVRTLLFGSSIGPTLSIGGETLIGLATLVVIGALGGDVLTIVGYLAVFALVAYGVAFAIGEASAILVSRMTGRGTRAAAEIVLARLASVCVLPVLALAALAPLTTTIVASALNVPAHLAGAFAIAFSYFAAELVARTVLHAYLGALRGSGDLKGYSWLQVVPPIVLAIFLVAILAARLTFGALERLEDLIHAIGLAQVAALAIGCALAWARRKATSGAPGPHAQEGEVAPPTFREAVELLASLLANALFTPTIILVFGFLMAASGTAAAAAFAVISRIQPLLFVFGMGLASVCSVFFGQNEGAGARDRVESGFYEAAKLLLAVQFMVWIAAIALVHGTGEVGLVDAEVRDHLTSYVAIVTPSFAFLSLSTISIRLLNVLGRQAWAPALSFVRCFVLTIPPMFFGNALWQATGVFAGFALGNTISGVTSFLLVLYLLKSDRTMRAPARRRNCA